jgi:hypothetical protein
MHMTLPCRAVIPPKLRIQTARSPSPVAEDPGYAAGQFFHVVMNKLLPEFEHRAQPVIPPHHFLVRLAHSGIIALALIAVSLAIGMVGYRRLEGLSWIDAFLNASMLLGGMGPVNPPVTVGGKLFAGLYSLYCGLAVILVAGVVLAPVAHRLLHRFHVESRSG